MDKKMNKKFIVVGVIAIFIVAIIIGGFALSNQNNNQNKTNNTIMGSIQNNTDLATLKTALVATGLDIALNGNGPFTVFAPTDSAFAMLNPDVLKDLVQNQTDILAGILKYHVVSGSILSTDLSQGITNVTTLQGSNITVNVDSTGVFINNAKVTVADVLCTNGVIHVINAVLMPKMDIVNTAIVNGNFKTLVTALNVTNLDTALQGTGPFTVFAPTDSAFAMLNPDVLKDLVQNQTDILAGILKYHVVSGSILSTDLSQGITNVTTLQGSNITVNVDSTGVFINNAKVTVADVLCTNGVIHVINAVLMPS